MGAVVRVLRPIRHIKIVANALQKKATQNIPGSVGGSSRFDLAGSPAVLFQKQGLHPRINLWFNGPSSVCHYPTAKRIIKFIATQRLEEGQTYSAGQEGVYLKRYNNEIHLYFGVQDPARLIIADSPEKGSEWFSNSLSSGSGAAVIALRTKPRLVNPSPATPATDSSPTPSELDSITAHFRAKNNLFEKAVLFGRLAPRSRELILRNLSNTEIAEFINYLALDEVVELYQQLLWGNLQRDPGEALALLIKIYSAIDPKEKKAEFYSQLSSKGAHRILLANLSSQNTLELYKCLINQGLGARFLGETLDCDNTHLFFALPAQEIKRNEALFPLEIKRFKIYLTQPEHADRVIRILGIKKAASIYESLSPIDRLMVRVAVNSWNWFGLVIRKGL